MKTIPRSYLLRRLIYSPTFQQVSIQYLHYRYTFGAEWCKQTGEMVKAGLINLESFQWLNQPSHQENYKI